MKKQLAIICDLDGTLCNIKHRLHLHPSNRGITTEPYLQDAYDEFNSYLIYDKPYWRIWLLLKLANLFRIKIIFMTARPSKFEFMTHCWIKRYWLTYRLLFLRGGGDNRSDWEVKKDYYDPMDKNYFKIILAIDDRESVCKMWRSLGLRTLKVRNGGIK